MKKILTFLTFSCLSISSFAFFSIPITEGIVNSTISSSFPKEVKKVELTDPKIFLLDGNTALLCLTGQPKIMFIDKKFQFCSNFVPKWNAEKKSLEATNLQLVDFDINGITKVNGSVKILVNQLLPYIDAVTLYKTDSWIGKQVSEIEVSKGMLYIKF